MRFEVVDDKFRKYPNNSVKLPKKSTRHSVGYDFYSNQDFILDPGDTKIFWTDIKVKLKPNEFLMIVPRSSIGIHKHLMLANTVGIIDPDYYDNVDNGGNIGIAMYNYGKSQVTVHEGERIAQGIILEFVDDRNNVENVKRSGGIGSTGNK